MAEPAIEESCARRVTASRCLASFRLAKAHAVAAFEGLTPRAYCSMPTAM